MIRQERQQAILDILKNLRGLDPLKQLFWSELNYQRVNQPLSRRDWTSTTSMAIVEDPILFASGGQDDAFHVIYARLANDQLLLGQERPVISRLLRDHPYALFVCSNTTQDRWHFINVKYEEDSTKRRSFRRITVGSDERLRTASERLDMLDLETVSRDLFGLSPLLVQERHDEAFDVEAVTKQFFDEYQTIFNILEKDLAKQTKDTAWAHVYALQFLNRCMFLYFIQRKGWLGNDRDFLSSFWGSYQHSAQNNDSFVDKWLHVLFFEAFNNKFHGGHKHFPEGIKEALSLAPFLNGGLFTENELDTGYRVDISDKLFGQVFKFLERYNFTIAEDSPLDKEVAVDPAMIGKVYESLVNVSEGVDERGEAGIFYTPRTEIDLMCRLALVDHLTNHLVEERKNLLYQLVFALEPDVKVDADKAIANAALWPDISKRLHEITVLDPACGSGSFLVGMLNILDDLQARANQQLSFQENSYDRKKRIIGQSLYGVDIMDWACHVSELRLWLSLVIDADFTLEELHVRREPLLPYFSFKIRCGDSLVQEVGGINLGHIRESHDIPPSLKARITALRNEKQKFYDNDPSCQFRSIDAVKQEERRLFQDILDARYHEVQEDIKSLRRKIEGPQERQIRLDGTMKPHSHQMDLQAAKYQEQLEAMKLEIDQIEKSREALRIAKQVPFVWDIAFVEIFEGEEQGFDIVVGNPPYVRQESISDPSLPREQVTTENKRDYKNKLARSVYRAFPRFFGYNSATNSAAHRIDAKSDLYIYFYLHGLSLLNTKGSFCFITSNSWLDVGYGADLQEFLLKHCHVKMVLDNQAKRSFSNADVNTIIVLFSSTDDHSQWALEKTARFIMFRVPFEYIVSPIIFDEIEETSERKTTPEYRAFPIQQGMLLKDGCEVKEDEEEQAETTLGPLIKFERYTGNKWGGKYLRAPDVYWTILEESKGKFIRLGEIGDIFPGCYSGINDFFYLSRVEIEKWGIENQFLTPLLRSPQQVQALNIDDSIDTFVLNCQLTKDELKSGSFIYVLDYIEWGESQVTRKRQKTVAGIPWPKTETVRYRKPGWWAIPDRSLRPAGLFMLYVINERFLCPYSSQGLVSDRCFHRVLLKNRDEEYLLFTLLNSTLSYFFITMLGRANLGLGAMKFETADANRLFVVDPSCLASKDKAALIHAFLPIASRPAMPLSREIESADRKEYDRILFNSLGLPETSQEILYKEIVEQVKQRISKAKTK